MLGSGDERSSELSSDECLGILQIIARMMRRYKLPGESLSTLVIAQLRKVVHRRQMACECE